MKSRKLLWFAAGLALFAACSKEDQPIDPVPPIEKPDPVELLKDSCSYTLNGKQISFNSVDYGSAFFVEPNSKVDSVTKYAKYISGDKDSVMYGQKFQLWDLQRQHYISISFVKKYHNNEMRAYALMGPKNLHTLFYSGAYPYAVDLFKENTQNGIAIAIRHEGAGFKSSGQDGFWIEPTTITKDAQKKSEFALISQKKLKSGLYLMEAKFKLLVFDQHEQPHQIENGYFRFRMNLDRINY
ncbi:hypothetical protein [Pedobacter sp.]|uniref:hypothetical protein n=1 Tax=Pedobacter sp. TaxID=1411316 RepID=UPI003BA921F8